MTTVSLEVRKLYGRFYICAGKSRLASCRTEEEARKLLTEGAKFWAYWAQSAGVSLENTTPNIAEA